MKLSRTLLLLILMLLGFMGKAQILTDSNLPIVVINTDGGVNIPDEPKVLGTMKIIWHEDGSRNYLTDIDSAKYLNYDGRIGIERRGSSSQNLPKKPYSLTTLLDDNVSNNNVSILGMPKENDWILNSLAFDQTGMRDFIAYKLSNDLGQYAVKCVYCEVVINGDYKGLYMMTEKIKRDKNRVDIVEMDESCINTPEVTGGYITKADKTTGGDPVAFQMEGYGGWGWWPNYVDFIHHYPKPENIKPQQTNYIKGVFQELANTSGQHNISPANGFPSVIDIPTFVDFMLVAEYTSNVDVYSISTFFHKDRNGKLRAGPVWDYNLAFGYDEYGNRSRYDVWQFSNGDNEGPKFFRDLFETDAFRCHLAKRWFEVTAEGQPFSHSSICALIDQTDELIAEGVERDNERWNRMNSHDSFINDLKTWLEQRINWMNQNIGSYEGCDEIDLPPLVISKIHYHPEDYWAIDGDQLEFIEITNNGDEVVDLTGVYFSKLGITYIFPNNSTIQPHEAIVLCSDSDAFREYYNTEPFGQFTRNLSNKSQHLVLADAWGNVIDEVEYFDSDPWPWEADGEGPYLELKDLNLDNSLAESWTLGYDLTNTNEYLGYQKIAVFPNPTSGVIHLRTDESLDAAQVFDLTGNIMLTSTLSNHTLDLSQLPSGLYLLKLQLSDGNAEWHKVVKQ